MKDIIKKWTSRKVLIVVLTAILDVLIAVGTITPDIKVLLLQLVTLLGSGYVVIEGIADIISRLKSNV